MNNELTREFFKSFIEEGVVCQAKKNEKILKGQTARVLDWILTERFLPYMMKKMKRGETAQTMTATRITLKRGFRRGMAV